MRGLRALARIGLAVAILAVCGWLLREQLARLDIDALRRAIAAVAPGQIALAALATLGSYASLAVVERGLFETAGVAVRWRRVLLGSFVANAVSACVGLVLVSAALLRVRLYGRWGVATRDAVYVSLAFAPLVILSGLLGAAMAIVLGLDDARPGESLGLAALLALPAAAFLAIDGGRELRWRRVRLEVPSRGRRLVLVAAGVGDWVCASGALFAVTGIALADWPAFLPRFVFGWLFGAASGLPAGAGIIDATMLRSFGNAANMAQLAAGLLLFRLLYFALPTLAALGLLALTELKDR